MRFRVTLEDLTCRLYTRPPIVDIWEREVPPVAGGFIETASDCMSRYGSGGTTCTEDCRGLLGYRVLKVEPVAQEAGFRELERGRKPSASDGKDAVPGLVYQIPRGA